MFSSPAKLFYCYSRSVTKPPESQGINSSYYTTSPQWNPSRLLDKEIVTDNPKQQSHYLNIPASPGSCILEILKNSPKIRRTVPNSNITILKPKETLIEEETYSRNLQPVWNREEGKTHFSGHPIYKKVESRLRIQDILNRILHLPYPLLFS